MAILDSSTEHDNKEPYGEAAAKESAAENEEREGETNRRKITRKRRQEERKLLKRKKKKPDGRANESLKWLYSSRTDRAVKRDNVSLKPCAESANGFHARTDTMLQ